MKPRINVGTIVTDWLKANGYDGLYSKIGDCGCSLEHLFVCEAEGIELCKPAYKIPCTCGEEHDYDMTLEDK